MYLYVFVTKDSLETPFPVVTDQQQPQQNQKLLIHADQVLVELMQNAEKEMEQPPVHVYLDSMVIHMWNVNQNVPSIQNVHLIGRAVTLNVLTLVRDFVE